MNDDLIISGYGADRAINTESTTTITGYGYSRTCYWDGSTREMVNVAENRTRKGVTDCPESRNEGKFQSMEFWTRRGTRRRFEDPSRYAMDLKYLKSSGFLREDYYLLLLELRRPADKKHTHFYHPITILKPSEVMDRTKDHIYKY
ncbi:hypothetical protein E3N88_10707 [Mikania micrantha]|uniref:Uncharacterized protein n=1 Tax=Mikania micrantha TaxID=192012 RepID=A0A5N6PE93_9ASTR|nr:hypothetical protein E3N88_10707 [Mikania micrantha]